MTEEKFNQISVVKNQISCLKDFLSICVSSERITLQASLDNRFSTTETISLGEDDEELKSFIKEYYTKKLKALQKQFEEL